VSVRKKATPRARSVRTARRISPFSIGTLTLGAALPSVVVRLVEVPRGPDRDHAALRRRRLRGLVLDRQVQKLVVEAEPRTRRLAVRKRREVDQVRGALL